MERLQKKDKDERNVHVADGKLLYSAESEYL